MPDKDGHLTQHDIDSISSDMESGWMSGNNDRTYKDVTLSHPDQNINGRKQMTESDEKNTTEHSQGTYGRYADGCEYAIYEIEADQGKELERQFAAFARHTMDEIKQ